jgi:hypothetical protein
MSRFARHDVAIREKTEGVGSVLTNYSINSILRILPICKPFSGKVNIRREYFNLKAIFSKNCIKCEIFFLLLHKIHFFVWDKKHIATI